MKKVVTPEIEKFIIDNANLFSTRKIAEMSSVSRDTVRRIFRRNNIEVPIELRQKWKSDAVKGKTTFTPEEDEIIKQNYLDLPVKRIGQMIGRSFTGITSRLNQLGLIIPDNLKAERKAKGMFRKGQEPPNKGKKMSPELYEKVKHTFFQKNHIPSNALPEGSEVERKDKSGRSYWMIKIPGNRKLIHKHVWIWQTQYGKVPKSHNIIFKNGNSLDCRLENLECISDGQLLKRNSMYNYPEELVRAIQLKSAIKRKINRLNKISK
jgi:hypothetical protein